MIFAGADLLNSSFVLGLVTMVSSAVTIVLGAYVAYWIRGREVATKQRIEDEAAKAERAVAEKRTEAEQLQAERAELRQVYREELAALRKELVTARTRINELQSEIDDLNSEVRRHTRTISDQAEELGKLREQLNGHGY